MNQTKAFRSALIPTVVAVAGLAVTMSVTETSDADNRYPSRIGLRAWQDLGITGRGAVIGSLDGLPPLVNTGMPFLGAIPVNTHRAFAKSNPITIVFEEDGLDRRTMANIFDHSHQTATLGAMVASSTGDNAGPIGIAPDAQSLVGWFAIDRDQSGFFTDAGLAMNTSQVFDALTYALFGMTGQDYANVIAADTGIPFYNVATVVNSSFGVEGTASRRGEDIVARIYNACVTMTDATLVAPTSNDGNAEDPSGDMSDPLLTDLGRVYSPGGAMNTISVGYVNRDFSNVSTFSGKGPMQAQNYADTGLGDLYPTTDMDFVNPFTPDDGGDLESVGGVFRDVRPGVDIVAPGELLTLPGETFILSGSPLNSVAYSEWTGVSFSSAIVAGAVGLMHELGEREGYSISSVVTRAVLLNAANKSDDNIGVGFDNEQQIDQMEDDRPSVTTRGLDEEVGAGSLDLNRLIRQYHLGTVITDYTGGSKMTGFSNNGSLQAEPGQSDSIQYTVFQDSNGTNPAIPFVTFQQSNPSSPLYFTRTCQMAFGLNGALDPEQQETRDPWLDGRIETQVAQLYGPFIEPVERLMDEEYPRIAPMARRDNPPLGDGDPDLGGGDGGSSVPGASGDEITGGGGGGAGLESAFRSGWDHGNIGEGHIDLPIGPITPNSGITVTLTWNRHENWNLLPSSFANQANIVNFGSGGDGGGANFDATILNEFEMENLDLELWQVPNGPGGQRLIAASRGVWTNTECIHFPYVGGAPDGSDTGPFGNSPADYFIRIVFNQTLWDYGGFYFCNGGMNSQPKESVPRMGFNDMPRAQVEYGLAWWVDFNTDGYPEARRSINPESGAIEISIVGVDTNLDVFFEAVVGDLNEDFFVDARDAALMIQNFGSTDPAFDLNNDGVADALDLQMVSQHVGQRAERRELTREEKQAEKQRRKAYKKSVNQRRKDNKKASKKLVQNGRREARQNRRR